VDALINKVWFHFFIEFRQKKRRIPSKRFDFFIGFFGPRVSGPPPYTLPSLSQNVTPRPLLKKKLKRSHSCPPESSLPRQSKRLLAPESPPPQSLLRHRSPVASSPPIRSRWLPHRPRDPVTGRLLTVELRSPLRQPSDVPPGRQPSVGEPR
jgi:hypothetical protein